MSFTNESSANSCRVMGDAARLSLAASAVCFITAGTGCALNRYVPDAICAEELVVIGCFYLIIGAVDLVRMRSLDSHGQRREGTEAAGEPS